MGAVSVDKDGRLWVRCDECETLVDTKIINTGHLIIHGLEISCPVCQFDIRLSDLRFG